MIVLGHLPRKIVSKATVLALMVVCIFVLVSANQLSFPQQLHRSIKQHFKAAYNSITASGSASPDNDPEFEARLAAIYHHKIANDWSNELWALHLEADVPLNITIPDYYATQQKPPIQPFDPRLTVAAYLHHLTSDPGQVPFHWSDWVDLSILDRYILNPVKLIDPCTSLFDIRGDQELIQGSIVLDPSHYCIADDSFPLGYRIVKFSGQQTEANHEILGKSYLYSAAPSPLKLVFLTSDSESYQVEVAEPETSSLDRSLLHNGMVERMVEDGRLDMAQPLNVVQAYQALTHQRPPAAMPLVGADKIDIPEQVFQVDPQREIEELEKHPLSRSHQAYVDSLKNSVNNNDPPKFFSEAKLLTGTTNNWRGEHYDWRFFGGITIGDDSHLATLHRLLKNYLHFARSHNLNTWIAHGSLLSWYWNGIAFPWDTDIDVQMPVEDLYRLARDFNQTLVVESAATAAGQFDGMGRYFVDVGSSITHRTRGNGNNNIDARFIDVDTGLYIDITGLALTETPVPERLRLVANHTSAVPPTTASIKAYNCRNMHYNTHDELSPLVRTVVENQVGYVPSNFIVALNAEYTARSMTEVVYKDHFYNSDLRMWMPVQTVADYLSQPAHWLSMRNSTLNNPTVSDIKARDLRSTVRSLTVDQHLDLLQDNEFFGEYMRTRRFTRFHQSEMALLLDPRGRSQAHSTLLHGYSAGGGLKPDVFMDAAMKDMQKSDYGARLQRVQELARLYGNP